MASTCPFSAAAAASAWSLSQASRKESAFFRYSWTYSLVYFHLRLMLVRYSWKSVSMGCPKDSATTLSLYGTCFLEAFKDWSFF